MRNPLRCSFPDCDCFAICDDYRTRPVHCPEELSSVVHHRVFSWLDNSRHRPAAGSGEDVQGVRGPADYLPDAAMGCELHMRTTLGDAPDDSEVLHRRVLAVLAGLAIGSTVVLLYAVLT